MEDNRVATTPTRPPNRPRKGGRPPEGPSTVPPRRRISYDLARARLTAGAEHLRAQDSKELKAAAETIDALLAPRGWEILRPSARQEDADPNLAIWMNRSIKEFLEAKAGLEARAEAEESGQPAKAPGTVLARVIDEGFRAFLEGRFVPERPLRSARGSATEKQNLNVRPSKALRDAVQEVCPAKSKELGWPVTPGLVAAAWLYSEYGITEDDQRGVTVPQLPVLDD